METQYGQILQGKYLEDDTNFSYCQTYMEERNIYIYCDYTAWSIYALSKKTNKHKFTLWKMLKFLLLTHI